MSNETKSELTEVRSNQIFVMLPKKIFGNVQLAVRRFKRLMSEMKSKANDRKVAGNFVHNPKEIAESIIDILVEVLEGQVSRVELVQFFIGQVPQFPDVPIEVKQKIAKDMFTKFLKEPDFVQELYEETFGSNRRELSSNEEIGIVRVLREYNRIYDLVPHKIAKELKANEEEVRATLAYLYTEMLTEILPKE